jgi:hypothetical protein
MNASFVALLPWFIPVCTASSAVLIAALKMRPANRLADETVAEGQYDRLLKWAEKMEQRVRALEQEVAECHHERDTAIRERDAALADVARHEAINLGMGLGRQRAAEVVAGDRADKSLRRKRGVDE